MPHDRMLATRHTYTWIQKYIFPGGLLPSVTAIEQRGRVHPAAGHRPGGLRCALRARRCGSGGSGSAPGPARCGTRVRRGVHGHVDLLSLLLRGRVPGRVPRCLPADPGPAYDRARTPPRASSLAGGTCRARPPCWCGCGRGTAARPARLAARSCAVRRGRCAGCSGARVSLAWPGPTSPASWTWTGTWRTGCAGRGTRRHAQPDQDPDWGPAPAPATLAAGPRRRPGRPPPAALGGPPARRPPPGPPFRPPTFPGSRPRGHRRPLRPACRVLPAHPGSQHGVLVRLLDAAADTLADAQRDKLELICRKLALQPGPRLLDMGCGWGSLTVHAARDHRAQVTAVTLSASRAATSGAGPRPGPRRPGGGPDPGLPGHR